MDKDFKGNKVALDTYSLINLLAKYLEGVVSFCNSEIIEIEFESSSMENQLFEHGKEAGFPLLYFNNFRVAKRSNGGSLRPNLETT